MQFVVNHLTFDITVEMDREFLACMKLLGVEPGKVYNEEIALKIDKIKFKEIADKVRLENLAAISRPVEKDKVPLMFQPKGQTDLYTTLILSIVAVYSRCCANQGLSNSMVPQPPSFSEFRWS